MKFYFWMLFLLLAGCATSTQAPVVERAPSPPKKTVKPASAAKQPATPEKDWRPDAYTVKKGDTLYSLGLEFGFDHEEIAQWNNIQPPYRIYVGQVLKLKDPKAAASQTVVTPAGSDTAVATPLKLEPAPTARPLDGSPSPVDAGSVKSDTLPLLTEPKALKEPYSLKAMNVEPAPKSPAIVQKPAATSPPAEKPAVADTAKPDSAKPEAPAEKPAAATDDEAVEWAWPVKGKILAGFSDAGSKGLDIAGEQGQPVHAAAAGKVVYSGSGLRGYGKLIIIKHNKTYLSAYAHNSQLLVKEGQAVAKGQKIAEMGNSDTDRVKLHFEIRKLGRPVDPGKYLPDSGN